MIIPHSSPLIDEKDIQAVSGVLASGHIAQGEKVKEFEKEVAEFVGSSYGVAVSSGTSALHLALLSLGIKKGDEVIIPSYVCSSLYMSIVQSRAIPRIVDINPDFNLSPVSVKNALNSRTKAVIAPHMFGTPAELDELIHLDIPVIEDCAQSLGAQYRNKKVGNFGRITICSFYATKMITTGEGGMVLTNDSDIFQNILERREYDKKTLKISRFNYKMTDFQAALGLSQLKKLDYFIERRRMIAETYKKQFSPFNIQLPELPSYKKSVFYRYIIMTEKKDIVQKRAYEKGIICERPVSTPIHQELGLKQFPGSDHAFDNALSIPLYPKLTGKEIDYLTDKICAILREI